MYIKQSFKTDRKTGTSYFAYHLVESVRTDKGPRQRVLLYMGSTIDLAIQEHKALAERIEAIITGQPSLFPSTPAVERLAQMYASQVINRLSDNIEDKNNSNSDDAEDLFVTINANSLEYSDPRSVGTEHVLLEMAKQLDLPKKLHELGLSKTDVSLALGSIIARAAAPNSERATYDWLCNKSGLSELLDFDFSKSSLDKLYQVSDKLLSNKTALESHLECKEQEYHGFKSTIALYDLTNTYMEGQANANPKAKHGFSKEKRSDCPLVTMGLVMNEHGFLNRTSILPGNISEPKTLEDMIKNLTPQPSLEKPIIILDAGISTDTNLAWLRENKYKYIVSARKGAPCTEIEGALVHVGDRNNLVKAAIIKTDCYDEKWLYCESEAKASVADKMKQSFRSRFEDSLNRLNESLKKPRGRKKHLTVVERIGRLKEKHKNISACYEINVIASEDGLNATLVDWKVIREKMDEKLTGKYFLRTNILETDPKTLWQLYNTLRGIEDSFRFMKSSLGLRPVYHQKEKRVDGHLWITILAYHLIKQCLYQLNKDEINNHWQTIREILSNRSRVTMQAKTKEGNTLHHRGTTKATENQIDIYRSLHLSSSILRSKKFII